VGYLPDNTSTRNSSIATIAARSLLAFAEHPTPIRAELSGGRRCSAIGITATGNAPVLALCRRLIEAGHNPTLPLEAYRGTTLCLRVRSIGEGAKLTVTEATSDGKPRFVPHHPFQDVRDSVGGRSPVAQKPPGVVRYPPGGNSRPRPPVTPNNLFGPPGNRTPPKTPSAGGVRG